MLPLEIARQLVARTEDRPDLGLQLQQHHYEARGLAFFIVSVVTGDQLAAATAVYQYQQIPVGLAWGLHHKETIVGWAEDNWRSILYDRVRADLRRAPEPFHPSVYERRRAAHRASAQRAASQAHTMVRGMMLRKGLDRWLQQYQQYQQYRN
ncbi:hypothetical protein MCOR25_008362 [Pyricularia grisea]|nr:hypothetical protein MCOR25_008362 [Pyricularia grisea]